MTPGTNFDALLAVFSDLIAARVGARLTGREGGREEDRKVQNRLLSVEDAAEYLGRTKEAVQHLLAAGKLSFVKTDRPVLPDCRDLNQWMERSKIQ